MSNEAQYINPIINTMMETNQQQLNAQQMAQQLQIAKQQKAIQEHQLGIEETKAQHEHEYQSGMLDINRALKQAEADRNNLDTIKALRDMSTSGVDISKFTNPQGNITLPGSSFSVPATAFPSQQENIQRQLDFLRQQEQMKQEVTEPFQIRQEERTLTSAKALKQQEEDFQSKLEDKKIASAENLGKLERGTQLAIANATNATHLKVANMEYVPSPQNLASMIIAGATGQAQLNYANPQERAALSSIQEMGWRTPRKEDIQAIQQAQTLGPLFNKLEDFANQYLPSETGPLGSTGAKVSSYLQGKVAGTAFPSDVKNKIAEIKTNAMNVGKVIEGLTGGRVTNTQLGLALDAMTSPGITREQALDRLNSVKDLYINKQQNVIMGGMPKEQQNLIQKTYGIKPSWLIAAPRINTLGHQLDENESLKRGQPVYAGN